MFENTLLLLLFTSRNNTFLGKLLLATLKKKVTFILTLTHKKHKKKMSAYDLKGICNFLNPSYSNQLRITPILCTYTNDYTVIDIL